MTRAAREQVEGRSHSNIPHQKAARPAGKKKCECNLEVLLENLIVEGFESYEEKE